MQICYIPGYLKKSAQKAENMMWNVFLPLFKHELTFETLYVGHQFSTSKKCSH